MLTLLGLITAVPPLRALFELMPLRPADYLLVTMAAAVWALVLRLTWRGRLLQCVLGVGTSPAVVKLGGMPRSGSERFAVPEDVRVSFWPFRITGGG